MVVATVTSYTPEDLLTMPDGDRYELIDGQLVERSMSAGSSLTAGEVFWELKNCSLTIHPGWVYPEGASFQCFSDRPQRVRRADASFFDLDRLTREQAEARGHIHIAPDLVVEVVSPNDSLYDVDEKVEEWLSAGVRMIWVINPENRTVRVYRADGSSQFLRESNELVAEDVLPGFRIPVAKLFNRS